VTDASAERADAGALEAQALAEAAPSASYASGAKILSVGIAATGLFTFLYFAVASHVLDAELYGAVALLWSILFVVISVIYRPVEQLLSRSIADRRARGLHHGHPLRIPLGIQAGFALTFLAVALALRPQVEALFDSTALYWIFTGAGLAYAASYFARGYFAGHQWFALYGGLVLFESLSRFCFPVAVAAGLATGQTAVALGILAAPIASLLVVPWAIARHSRLDAGAPPPDASPMTLRAGGGFALAVAGIQLGEQTLLNGGVIVANGVAGAAVAGAVFNALLITRAPLQLFQSVQTSLLPHLAGLEATEGHDSFARAIRVTVLAIAGFAGAVALGLLLIGPWVMQLVFGDDTDFGRVGLMVVALGMGFHLAAGTLNQANATRVTLAGGALAKNIFWQVAGAVTLGTNAHFEGVVLGKTMIAVNTGTSVNGRLLAQTAVTLQMNAVTKPAK